MVHLTKRQHQFTLVVRIPVFKSAGFLLSGHNITDRYHIHVLNVVPKVHVYSRIFMIGCFPRKKIIHKFSEGWKSKMTVRDKPPNDSFNMHMILLGFVCFRNMRFKMDPRDLFTRIYRGCSRDIMTSCMITSLLIHLGLDCSTCLTRVMWEWWILTLYMLNFSRGT